MIQLPIIYKHNNTVIKDKLEQLHALLITFNNTYRYEFINKNYLYLIEYCIKKLHKVEFDDLQIKRKMNEEDIEEKLRDYSVCKIFNFLVG